jgi:hypothetical protein
MNNTLRFKNLTLPVSFRVVIAFAIIIFTFIISRLPFFIYFPIVGHHPDTAVYFLALEGIYNGELPKFGTVPPLYPLFLYFFGLLSDNVLIYVYVQVFFSLLSSLFLIYSFSKYIPKLTIPVSICLSIFFISSHSIVYDTTLVTESLYVSSWIALFACFIWIVNSDRKIPWVFFSILLSIPLLLRPNGIIVFFFLALIITYILFSKRNKKLVFILLMPFTTIVAIVLLYTYITLGLILPERVLNYFTSNKISSYDIAIDSYQGLDTPYTLEEYNIIKKVNERKAKNLHQGRSFFKNNLIFLNSISYESSPFYNHEIYYRFDLLYNKNYVNKKHHTNTLVIVPMSDTFKSRVYKNYYPRLPEIDFENCCDFINNKNSAMNKSVFFKIYYWLYNYVFLVFFRNKLLLLILGVSLLCSVYKAIKSKMTDKISLYSIFLFSLLFLTSVITVKSGHNPGQMRYTYSTEFVIYISLVFIPYLWNIKSIIKGENIH